MHSPPRNGEGFWTPGTVGRQDVASPQPSGEGDHPFPHPIPLPATGSSLLAGSPPCTAPQAGQQTGGHPHGAGALERRKTVHVLEAGCGWRITGGRGRAEGHPPSPTGLGSAMAPADASSGHQGAPHPPPPLPPPLPPGPACKGCPTVVGTPGQNRAPSTHAPSGQALVLQVLQAGGEAGEGPDTEWITGRAGHTPNGTAEWARESSWALQTTRAGGGG